MFSAFAVDPSSLVTRFTEGLRLMKALWTEPRVDCEGRFWQLQGAAIAPPPFQKPHPPTWFGAHHPAALARTVRHGDGFFGAGSTTTAQFAQQVPLVRRRSPRPAGPRPASGSPSASTSRSTTTPSVPVVGSPPRWSGSGVTSARAWGRAERSRRWGCASTRRSNRARPGYCCSTPVLSTSSASRRRCRTSPGPLRPCPSTCG